MVPGSGFLASASSPGGDDMLRMLVTGGSPSFGGGGMPPAQQHHLAFVASLARFFLLIGLRRGLVLCLRHSGMIAPILTGEKQLGFARH
jgi:hypothetical protein